MLIYNGSSKDIRCMKVAICLHIIVKCRSLCHALQILKTLVKLFPYVVFLTVIKEKYTGQHMYKAYKPYTCAVY